MSHRISHPKPQEPAADRTAESRERILEAALREFSVKGLDGARIDQIAAVAGVNKALLYYYYASKDRLYEAALEWVAARILESSLAVLQRDASAGERVLRVALNHFDRILTQREFQSLMQQEMIRLHRGEEGAISVLIDRVFKPAIMSFQATVCEGMAAGELIQADWLQMQLAGLGANVFYFLTAPVLQVIMNFDPFSADALKTRRVALVRFLGQALFADRQRGAELSEQVLADTPVPNVEEFRLKYPLLTNAGTEKSE